MIDNKYFDWLKSHIKANRRPYDKYERLLLILYFREFTWTIELDENRAFDGNRLREIYEDETDCKACKDGFCSVLEALIGLSIRGDDIINGPGDEEPEKLFWLMIDNLGLMKFTDNALACQDEFEDYEAVINQKLDIFLERKYREDGFGGLFVLKNPPKDLRKVEIWYQMNWFLSEEDGYDLRKIGGF